MTKNVQLEKLVAVGIDLNNVLYIVTEICMLSIQPSRDQPENQEDIIMQWQSSIINNRETDNEGKKKLLGNNDYQFHLYLLTSCNISYLLLWLHPFYVLPCN